MEIDFLGLNSMHPFPSYLKPEIPHQENQWPFMKEDEMSKLVTEPIRSSAEAFNRCKLSSMPETQNISLSLSNQIAKKPTFVGFGQSFTDSVIRQQFEGFQKPVSTPIGQVVGFTEPWNNSSKSSSPPPQMTIFYGGTVSVYEGISPEKAQAIMLLAGNASFFGSNYNSQSPQIRIPSNVTDKQNPNPQPDAEKYEQKAVKPTEISPFPVVIKPEVQRVIPSRGPVSMPSMMPSVVPQFRKASLARFLEKRKERVMNAGPYTCEKKQPDDDVNPANGNVGSANQITS